MYKHLPRKIIIILMNDLILSSIPPFIHTRIFLKLHSHQGFSSLIAEAIFPSFTRKFIIFSLKSHNLIIYNLLNGRGNQFTVLLMCIYVYIYFFNTQLIMEVFLGIYLSYIPILYTYHFSFIHHPEFGIHHSCKLIPRI